MSYPQNEEKIILDTDASLYGIGAVPSQIQIKNGEEIEKVIAFASITLSKSEQKLLYNIQIAFSSKCFDKHFRHFLYGNKFLIRTDHASLIWLRYFKNFKNFNFKNFNFKNSEGMLARRISYLETYNYEFVQRKGTLHGNADSLFRMPYPYCKRFYCHDCKSRS